MSRRKGRAKKKLDEEESVRREDALCQPKLIVGVNLIVTRSW